jgi:hypothetical protein
MIMKKILFILVAALIVGCKTCEPIVQTVEKERIVEVRTHDTTIVTEADSASVHALLRCDSAYNVVVWELTTLQGERIEASVGTQKQGKDLLLSLDCKEDSLLNIIAWQDSIIRNNTTQTIVKVEKQKDFVWYCGVAFIIIIVLYTIWNVARVVLKFYGIKL